MCTVSNRFEILSKLYRRCPVTSWIDWIGTYDPWLEVDYAQPDTSTK